MLPQEADDFIYEILDEQDPGSMETAKTLDFSGKDLEKEGEYALAAVIRCRAGVIFEQNRHYREAGFSFGRAASDVNDLRLYELKAVLNERALHDYLEANDHVNAAFCAFRIAEFYAYQEIGTMARTYFGRGEELIGLITKPPAKLLRLRSDVESRVGQFI